MIALPGAKSGNSIGLFIVYRAIDEEGPWTPLHRDNVPDWIKNDDNVMGWLAEGYMLKNESIDSQFFYIAAEQPLDAIRH